MKTLYEVYVRLSELGIARSMCMDTNSIECYCTSEAMLYLLYGLNFNDNFTYHAELISSCTWLLTLSNNNEQ